MKLIWLMAIVCAGLVLSGCSGPTPTPTAPALDMAIVQGVQQALQDAESIPVLNTLETDDLAIVEVIDQMCPIAAGQHTVTLGDLTENEYIQTEILEYCAAVRPGLFPAASTDGLHPGWVTLFTLTFERVDSPDDIPSMFEVRGLEAYRILTLLCALADGDYEPEVSLSDFSEDTDVETAIHDSCATF